MIHLDFITYLWVILRNIWDFCVDNIVLFNWIETFFSKISIYFGQYMVLFNKVFVERFMQYLIESAPRTLFSNIKQILVCYRNLCNARLLLMWFPNINPWRGPWPYLTESVDVLLRPLSWRFPKFYYMDFSTWGLFFALDSLIDICAYISEMADEYHGFI